MANFGATGLVSPEEVVAVGSQDPRFDDRYQQLARSVGCICANSEPFATGWIVARNRVVTNAHVVVHARQQKGSNVSFTIAFGSHASGGEDHELDLLCYEHGFKPDIAIFRLPWTDHPDPIPVGPNTSKEMEVTLVGYPLKYPDRGEPPPQYDAARQSLLTNLERKVFSRGKITTLDNKAFWHTCNSVPGCSGSVILVDIGGTLGAVGVHACGEWVGPDGQINSTGCGSSGPSPANQAWAMRTIDPQCG